MQKNASGTSKDLVDEKEEIKCNNIIKRYKKWLTLMLQKKTRKNIIQIAKKFLTIYKDYQSLDALDLERQTH